MQPEKKDFVVRSGIRMGIDHARKQMALVVLGILCFLFAWMTGGTSPEVFGQDAAASGGELPAIAPDAGQIPESDNSPLAQAIGISGRN